MRSVEHWHPRRHIADRGVFVVFISGHRTYKTMDAAQIAVVDPHRHRTYKAPGHFTGQTLYKPDLQAISHSYSTSYNISYVNLFMGVTIYINLCSARTYVDCCILCG